MANSSDNIFRFPHFSIDQEGATMKVNTDGVLLGKWASEKIQQNNVERLLDIGTGTGVIALILAQQLSIVENNISIDAVEIDPASSLCATKNFKNSSWSQNLHCYNTSVQNFASENLDKQYSAIISNPPYFSNSLVSKSAGKAISRHTKELPFKELIHSVVTLLQDNGRFFVIIPSDQEAVFRKIAEKSFMYPTHICKVFPTPKSDKAKRVMLSFSKGLPKFSPICESINTEEFLKACSKY